MCKLRPSMTTSTSALSPSGAPTKDCAKPHQLSCKQSSKNSRVGREHGERAPGMQAEKRRLITVLFRGFKVQLHCSSLMEEMDLKYTAGDCALCEAVSCAAW